MSLLPSTWRAPLACPGACSNSGWQVTRLLSDVTCAWCFAVGQAAELRSRARSLQSMVYLSVQSIAGGGEAWV